MSSECRRAFVKELARENREYFGSPNGRGTLRSFKLAFDHSWTYLSELLQNALDANAHSIALRFTEDDSLVFQHDGERLRKEDVQALSTVYRSTKGASATGFMGVGFKSVFGRFREVRVSGWEWRFRYEINEVVGDKYGDRQPDLLGAVTPIWDETITVPEFGFTTRFEMRQLLNGSPHPRADVYRVLPKGDGDRTLLAILATSGLERFEVDGQVWQLCISDESDGTRKATALAGSESWTWRLFTCRFMPSEGAIAHFLEHREILLPTEDEREQVYAEVSKPREVLGVLPLDDEGKPAPPKRGRIYATLPTDVFLPFRIHVNADWLLNISRGSLKDIEDNQWQREVADRIADLLAILLDWIARSVSDPDTAKSAFAVLALPSRDAGGLEAILAERRWLSRLRQLLEDAPVVPVWATAKVLIFAKVADVVVPPLELAKTFRRWPDLNPSVLLGGPVLMDQVLGSDGRRLLIGADLLRSMAPGDLAQRWPDGLERWWSTTSLGERERRGLIFRLWAAVAELASRQDWRETDLACIRTTSGEWIPTSKAMYLNEALPSDGEPGGHRVLQFIRPFIKDELRLPDGWLRALESSAREEEGSVRPLSSAEDWIKGRAQSISLKALIDEAMSYEQSSQAPDWSALVPLHNGRNIGIVRTLLVGYLWAL